MFDRMTDRARKIMGLARMAAVRYQHDYIGPEHILHGLATEASGVGASSLQNLDIDLAAIVRETEELLEMGDSPAVEGQLPFTVSAKRVLENALEEASRFGHTYVGSEHLLLGLLRLEDGIPASVLGALDLTPDRIRGEVVELLGEDPGPPTQTSPGAKPPAKAEAGHPAARVRQIEIALRVLLAEVELLREEIDVLEAGDAS